MNHLNLSLRQFGLNPFEWSIQRLQGSHYLITHRELKDFEFEGEVEYRNLRPRWKFIRLWTI
jgi:hypothetical protein